MFFFQEIVWHIYFEKLQWFSATVKSFWSKTYSFLTIISTFLQKCRNLFVPVLEWINLLLNQKSVYFRRIKPVNLFRTMLMVAIFLEVMDEIIDELNILRTFHSTIDIWQSSGNLLSKKANLQSQHLLQSSIISIQVILLVVLDIVETGDITVLQIWGHVSCWKTEDYFRAYNPKPVSELAYHVRIIWFLMLSTRKTVFCLLFRSCTSCSGWRNFWVVSHKSPSLVPLLSINLKFRVLNWEVVWRSFCYSKMKYSFDDIIFCIMLLNYNSRDCLSQ